MINVDLLAVSFPIDWLFTSFHISVIVFLLMILMSIGAILIISSSLLLLWNIGTIITSRCSTTVHLKKKKLIVYYLNSDRKLIGSKNSLSSFQIFDLALKRS